jgi:hypothetical protein
LSFVSTRNAPATSTEIETGWLRGWADAPGARKTSAIAGASAMAVAAARIAFFGEVGFISVSRFGVPVALFSFAPALTQDLSYPMLHSDPPNSDFGFSFLNRVRHAEY